MPKIQGFKVQVNLGQFVSLPVLDDAINPKAIVKWIQEKAYCSTASHGTSPSCGEEYLRVDQRALWNRDSTNGLHIPEVRQLFHFGRGRAAFP